MDITVEHGQERVGKDGERGGKGWRMHRGENEKIEKTLKVKRSIKTKAGESP